MRPVQQFHLSVSMRSCTCSIKLFAHQPTPYQHYVRVSFVCRPLHHRSQEITDVQSLHDWILPLSLPAMHVTYRYELREGCTLPPDSNSTFRGLLLKSMLLASCQDLSAPKSAHVPLVACSQAAVTEAGCCTEGRHTWRECRQKGQARSSVCTMACRHLWRCLP